MYKHTAFLYLILAFFSSACESLTYDHVLLIATKATTVPDSSDAVVLKGEFLDFGETPITAYGFYYAENQAGLELSQATPTVTKVTFTGRPEGREFEQRIFSLNKQTTYVYKAFAETAAGTKYGKQLSFQTGDITVPVYKGGVSNVTTAEARVAGSVSAAKLASLGGPILQHGHCWSTEPEPDINDSKTELGTLSQPQAFESHLTGLTSNTHYYVRTYITYNTASGTHQTEYSSNANDLTIKTQ